MTRHRWRLVVLVALWAGTVALFGALQMRPAVTVFAAIAVAAASALWWLLDVSDVVARVDWRATADTSGSVAGADARVSALRRQIVDARVFIDDTSLSRALVELADDVLHRWGVDRATQPGRAAAVLGPQLHAFVADPSDRSLLADPRRLGTIVAQLEWLSAQAPELTFAPGRAPAAAAHPSAQPSPQEPR